MEKYIDIINAYLNNELSKTEILDFENKIQSNNEFAVVYDEHLTLLKGIERVQLLEEISNARKTYIRNRWLKYVGIATVIILLSILIYSLITKSQSFENSNASGKNTVGFVKDSIITKDSNDHQVVIDADSIKKEKLNIITAKKEDEAIIIEKQNVVTETSSLKDISTFSYKEPQHIKVNTTEDFKMTLKEGTKISIPKNAFVIEKTGQPVSGTVDLKISEFYKLSDILLAGLSTKSDDKILETGGMLYIEANKNGSKLKLRPQKELKISFNNSGKENMQLFIGEKTDDDKINWILEQQLESIEVDELILDNEEVYVIDSLTGRIENDIISFQSVEEAPIYPGCENENDREKRDCMKAAIDKLVNRKFDISVGEDLNLTGKQIIRTSFEIDEEGNIGKIEARASQKELAEEAIRVIELMPKLIAGKQDGKSVKVKYYLPITFTIEGSEENSQNLSGNIRGGNRDSTVTVRSDKKFQEEIETKSISDISNSELERYTFSTTSLGWINCDRFVNSRKKSIKYKLKIKEADGANIKMIFKSTSSVLPSYESNNQYYFGDVPENEDVILLAIKKKGDKLYFGIKEVKTRLISELDLEFKPVSLKGLKNELSKLNHLFD